MSITGGDQKMHFDDINLDKNYTPSGAYGRSKLANILFTVELAKRLDGKSVVAFHHRGGDFPHGTARKSLGTLWFGPRLLTTMGKSLIPKFNFNILQ